MSISLPAFRKQVLRTTLFTSGNLRDATDRLGFVQADPIRSPARAQDLILRQRLKNYRAGDLERHYPSLDLEECFLFAYGFATHEIYRSMHPKPPIALSADHEAVLAFAKSHAPLHPRDLQALLGTGSATNGWGGNSRMSKLLLDTLHDRGCLRVAKREKGIRLYEPAKGIKSDRPRPERYQKLLLASLRAMGATTRGFLLKETGYHGYLAGDRPSRHALLQALIDEGRVQVDEVDGVEYLSIPESRSGRLNPHRVRILAPFDPVVRDRKRFEHFWGWAYRFEAYVPERKRQLGYYAMPVLWRDDVMGWANAAIEEGTLNVNFGYAKERADTRAFRDAAEAEVEHLTIFLGLQSGNWTIQT